MADSLRDQLVRIGVATQEQADRAAQKKRSQAGHKNAKRGGAKSAPNKTANKKPPTHKRPQKAAPNAKKKAPLPTLAEVNAKELAEKRAVKAKIKALIEDNRIGDHTGEVVYSYIVGSRVKQIHVTEKLKQQIVDGELAITRLNRHTMLIPSAVVPQIQALNPDWLIVRVTEAGGESTTSGAEDPYAEYDVPDDLMW